MSRAQTIHLSIYLASLFSSLGSTLTGRADLGTWLVAPAFLQSVLVFGGHLVTLDDDSPGGWSNPDGVSTVWHASLRELAFKFSALVIAIAVGAIAIGSR